MNTINKLLLLLAYPSVMMLAGCNENAPREQKDWDGTTEFYNSTDEK